MGFKIFILCIKQLCQNWNVALRLSWFWVLVLGLLLSWQSVSAPHFTNNVKAVSGTVFLVQTVLGIIISTIAVTSIAVGWHRYILRGEMPSKFHIINKSWPNFAYFLMGLQISIILFLIFFPISLFLVPAFTSLTSLTHPTALVFITILVNIFFVWFFLRLSLTLPAIAVGEDIRLGSSFALTRPVKYHLLVTATLIILVLSIPTLLFHAAIALSSHPSAFSTIGWLIFTGILNWFSFFVGVGVLTVIYDQLCEKNET